MLGDSTILGDSSGDAAATAAAAAAAASGEGRDGGESSTAAAAGGVGSNSGDEDKGGRSEDGDRSFGGNRWPRQETLALLKIRSDMDVAFRDASVKGPLWEEVSRKLAELGYNRSAKKCKEKFENVYKYHKRTKEGRTSKPDGKTYRFFDQLEALYQNHPGIQSPNPISSSKQHHIAPPMAAPPPPPTILSMPPMANTTAPPTTNHVTVPLTSKTVLPMTISQGIPSINLTIPSYQPPNLPSISTANPSQHLALPVHSSFPNIPAGLLSNSSSSSTSSDELNVEGRGRKRKRKWKDFFERIMKEVIEKQEELQKRFLEAIEKREHERMVREEAWRVQEIARINREREILAQERSIAATKDASVMAFLQKIAEQQNLGHALNNINLPQPQPEPQPQPQPQLQQPPQQSAAPPHVMQHFAPHVAVIPPPQQAPPPQPAPLPTAPQQLTQTQATNMEITRTDSGDNLLPASSSRWPKVEVQALINLRTSLDSKYQESGPKGPLWEEISGAMRKLGYNRNSKRCKEKWENINKYFKKVKESNKKRPEDSKTCPYFPQLDALYRERSKYGSPSSGNNQLKPENMMAPLMVRPEQQWPPQQDTERQPGQEVRMEDMENEGMDRHHEEEDDEDDDKEGDEEEEEDEEGGNYEIVASKPASSVRAAE
ncbi:trihelix transcription factor GT-2-like [Quillaja saponaria]|uniref:Trihelix transcription factor GT-2-like n=1 Tax=Quillaja saponaria TaxID=32244 RepID=A0AAD7Q3E0_QUISA|nr:trihelix transcription factor GT-2-like [Quillaja saponaria]